MLKLNQNVTKEYPEELIAQCRASTNQIVRLPVSDGRLRSATGALTLLEQTEHQNMTFSDIFEVTDFSYDPQTRGGHFRADISLCQAADHLEIDANILDLDSKTVVAQVPMVQNSHSTQLILQQDFTLDNNVSDHLGVITYGKWGNDSSAENELAIFREANTLDTEFTYEHIWPKKEQSAVILGELENFAPEAVEQGDNDHIVIALIRRPENTKDVDYICGYGRDKKNHPILCVPGKGNFAFPTDETAVNDKDHQNYAICRLYRKGGGAIVVAESEAYKLENNITINGQDNKYSYEFKGWGVGYDDPGGWKKTEFDYRLELNLYTRRPDGNWNTHFIVIDTRNVSQNITDEVKLLQIMYGCLAPDTKILMYDENQTAEEQKREIPICQVKIGDKVMGKNSHPMKVDNIWSGEELDSMVELWAEGMREPLLMTQTHPVWVQDADGVTGWKRAGQCTVKDKVLVADGEENWRSIIRLGSRESCGTVYNLELTPVNGCLRAMFCNGVLTGDQQVQNGER